MVRQARGKETPRSDLWRLVTQPFTPPCILTFPLRPLLALTCQATAGAKDAIHRPNDVNPLAGTRSRRATATVPTTPTTQTTPPTARRRLPRRARCARCPVTLAGVSHSRGTPLIQGALRRPILRTRL